MIRTSDRYIGKQVLFGTLYAVIVLGVVLVLGNLFKEIQPLLVEQKAPVEIVIRFVIGVLPVSLMYTVPWGFLSAVLLVFSRMSTQQEITAFRVSGVSLVRLSAPVFMIGAVLSLASLWLNLKVVPDSKSTITQLLYEQASRDPGSLLKPGVAQGDIKGGGQTNSRLLIEGKSEGWVEGFHFYQLGKDGGERTYVHADRAALVVDEAKSQLSLKLENAVFEKREGAGRVELVMAGKAEPLLIDLKDPRRKKKRASAMSNEEILEEIAVNRDMTEKKKIKFRSEITKRYSFSMACLAFSFIAVPLGIGARRRDTSGGLVASLVIGTAYFLISMLAGDSGSDKGATLFLWAPNVACILLGLYLFRRARFR
jgi:lipopolysaccharide export LptBFGC system permease protein LptF